MLVKLNLGTHVRWTGCHDKRWLIIILNELKDVMYDFVSYNEIGNVLEKHTRHGVNSSLGFVEAVIFISHLNMVIM